MLTPILGVPCLVHVALESLPLSLGVLLCVFLCANFPLLIRIPVTGLKSTLI